MAFNSISITPAISNTATLHASAQCDDIMDDTKPLRITLTMTDSNGNAYGYAQTFSVASGAVVTSPGNRVVAFASGDPNATTADRLVKFYAATQDVVKSLKNAGVITVTPRG